MLRRGRITYRLFGAAARMRGRHAGRAPHHIMVTGGGGTTRRKGLTSGPLPIEVGEGEVLSWGSGLARLSPVEGRSR